MRLASLNKLLILIASASVLMGASGCPKNAPEFEWKPKFWATDSDTSSIVRQDETGKVSQISCSSKKFDEMLCFHRSEPRKALAAAHKLINACAKWKTSAAPSAASELLLELEQITGDNLEE